MVKSYEGGYNELYFDIKDCRDSPKNANYRSLYLLHQSKEISDCVQFLPESTTKFICKPCIEVNIKRVSINYVKQCIICNSSLQGLDHLIHRAIIYPNIKLALTYDLRVFNISQVIGARELKYLSWSCNYHYIDLKNSTIDIKMYNDLFGRVDIPLEILNIIHEYSKLNI